MKKHLILLTIILTFISCQYENYPNHLYVVEKSQNVYNCVKKDSNTYNYIFSVVGEIKNIIYINRIDTINLNDTIIFKLNNTVCNGYSYNNNKYDFNPDKDFDVIIKIKYKLLESKQIY